MWNAYSIVQDLNLNKFHNTQQVLISYDDNQKTPWAPQ